MKQLRHKEKVVFTDNFGTSKPIVFENATVNLYDTNNKAHKYFVLVYNKDGKLEKETWFGSEWTLK